MLVVMACEHRLWLSDSIIIQLSSVADHGIRDGTECFLYTSSFLQWSVSRTGIVSSSRAKVSQPGCDEQNI